MTDLQLGEGLALPVDVVTRTAVVVGQKGTGKTSTAVVMLEEAAAAGARFAVIDPTGAWYGLRANAAGDGPGLDCVVMGGFNGDVPLDPGAGDVVARLVVEEGYNVVCDLERMTRAEQVTFVADFATTAYHRCRSAVTIAIDEARRFVPERGGKLEEDGQRCRAALVDVVQLGRRKGLGSILIGQRMTNIATDAREQADLLVIHRLLGTNDRKMIATWLEDAGADAPAILERIPKLATAHAAVLAPEHDVLGVFPIRRKRTFDSSATPEVGSVIIDLPKGRADIDLADLEAKMGHALEAAQENDPEALRRRVRKLEEQLAASGGADADELAAANERIIELERELERRPDVFGALLSIGQDAQKIADYAAVLRKGFRPDDDARASVPDGTEGVQSTAAPIGPDADDGQRDSRSNGGGRAPLSSPAGGGNAVDPGGARAQPGSSSEIAEGFYGDISKRVPSRSKPLEDGPAIKAGARRMLDVLSRYGPLPRRDLAVLSKVSPVSGTVSDYLSVLRQHAMVAEQDGLVGATAAGIDLLYPKAEGIPPKFTPEQVYGMWAGDLKAGARRMMDHLMRAHPEGYTRRELAGLAGISPQSGTVSDYMSVLRRRGLVEERARRVYAGHVLYLGAPR